MPWIQLHLAASAKQVTELEDQLETVGAQAVTMMDAQDQPIFEPAPGTTPVWEQTIVTGLFSEETDIESVVNELQRSLSFPVPEYRIEQLEDQPWERTWMDHFQPMQFGERLWICPSWCEKPDPQAINLMLDPGVAFGTGTHETTSLCLQWLDQNDLTQKQVLDFGCGSGVLAIAALLLGARHVVATDIDPQALQASGQNAEQNQVAQNLSLLLPEKVPTDLQADLVLANILAGPLLELGEKLAGYCKPGGQIVLSGILATQQQDILAHYGQWFDLDPVASMNDWVRISGTRR